MLEPGIETAVCVRFDLDMEFDGGSGEDLEHRVETRHALAAAVAQGNGPELGCRTLGHYPLPLGRPLKRRIVDYHQLAVVRDMDVELDAVHAEIARALFQTAKFTAPKYPPQ